jgi:hypothetical protein
MTCKHYSWTKRLLEGFEEVWIEFTCEDCGIEVGIEVCSLDELIYQKIGDASELAAKLQEEIDEAMN